MRDICIEQDVTSENLALIGEILGVAGVNIEGLSITSCNGRSTIHFLVEDATAAKRALGNYEISIKEISEVYILHKDKKCVTGKPGSFGGICRMLMDHGIKIKFGYPAENNRFVFGVDDTRRAKELLG